MSARAGKPHVVLAQWADTYYNAVAVEYAGLGVYGNKTCAPDVDAKELSVALARSEGGKAGGAWWCILGRRRIVLRAAQGLVGGE